MAVDRFEEATPRFAAQSMYHLVCNPASPRRIYLYPNQLSLYRGANFAYQKCFNSIVTILVFDICIKLHSLFSGNIHHSHRLDIPKGRKFVANFVSFQWHICVTARYTYGAIDACLFTSDLSAIKKRSWCIFKGYCCIMLALEE